MARIKIVDLDENVKISKEEMARVRGGYTDKEIMLGSAIPYNPFGYDSDEGSSSGSSSETGSSSGIDTTFPDVGKVPAPPAGSIPIPYPNIGKSK